MKTDVIRRESHFKSGRLTVVGSVDHEASLLQQFRV